MRSVLRRFGRAAAINLSFASAQSSELIENSSFLQSCCIVSARNAIKHVDVQGARKYHDLRDEVFGPAASKLNRIDILQCSKINPGFCG
jgi:hypothetical protein